MRGLGRAMTAAAAALALLGIESAHAQLDFAPCLVASAECGVLPVPLDEGDEGGPSVPIAVTRVRGAAGEGVPPLLVLTGGPGQSGLGALRGGAETMQALGQRAGGRDVISIDQRGTGVSALRCPAADETATGGQPASLVGTASQCAAEVGPSRVHYTTGDTVRDLERVRDALGVERWAMLGVSYGSYVGSVYARLHPERVDRLVLDSPVPLEGLSATDTVPFSAARRVLSELCDARACRGITRNLRSDTRRLAERLRARAVLGDAVDSSGRRGRAAVGGPRDPGALFQALVIGDQLPAARAALPGAIRSALRGDASMLNRILDSGPPAPPVSEQSTALFLATVCQESDVPWSAEDSAVGRRASLDAALSAQPPSTYAPFTVQDALGADVWPVCVGWPDVETYRPPPGGLPASVPTMVLVGTADVRTPLESARRIAASSPSVQVVPVRGASHSVLTEERECVDRALAAFFGDGSVPTGVCARAAEDAIPPVRVPPAGLAEVPSFSDLPPVLDRTLGAVLLTLADVEIALGLGIQNETSARGTGLRGGRVTGRLAGGSVVVRLSRDVYVPGVAVSGTLRDGAGRLRIDGRFARGALRLRPDGRISGRLGGQAVSLAPTSASQRLSSLQGLPSLGQATRIAHALERPAPTGWEPAGPRRAVP